MVKSSVWIAALFQVSASFRTVRQEAVVSSAQADYDEGELDAASFLEICDDSLVAKVCAAFTGDESRTDSATATELADALVVTVASMSDFLAELGLDGEEISCEELCLLTAESFPVERMPPASNLGCQWDGGEKVCDFDLSSRGLAAVAQTANPNRFHPANASDEIIVPRAIVPQEPNVPVQMPHGASFVQLQEEVANWFGIWLVLEEQGPVAQDVSAQRNCGTVDKTGCSGLGGTSNQREIDRLTLAYLVDTEQKIRRGCNNLMQKWFGSSSSSLIRTVLGGLQFISNTVRGGPYYVNWKNYAGYYGWVYPGEMVGGKLVVHFGKAYFDSRMADRIGTITHEVAHHPPLRRRDRQHRRRNGPKQYCDVPGCLGLARSDPAEAQLNDDNWSFMIDDLVGQGMNNNGGRPSVCSGGR